MSETVFDTPGAIPFWERQQGGTGGPITRILKDQERLRIGAAIRSLEEKIEMMEAIDLVNATDRQAEITNGKIAVIQDKIDALNARLTKVEN